MEFYARIPRETVVNEVTHTYYGQWTFAWYRHYRALAAVADGLRALEDPDIAAELGAERVLRARAFGKLVQGLAHAGLAIMYDQAFIVDETTELTDASGAPIPQEAVDYNAMMDAALGYFDDAATLAASGDFTIPNSWLRDDVTAAELIPITHSLSARYRAVVARTPAERAAVDWDEVIADVDAGIEDTWYLDMNYDEDFMNWALYYGTRPGWDQVGYFIIGMADQSGNYQTWLDTPVGQRRAIIDGQDILIVTPDLRFPQGSTVAEQIADSERENAEAEGRMYVIPQTSNGWGHNIAGVWARPDRGTWRWSYYWYAGSADYNSLDDYAWPEIDIAEMRLLKAEGLYRNGDMAGAAALVNVSRTENGLNATDAAGTNTSCVPRLPNESCGDLWEMLKWEKRQEVRGEGLMYAPWYFDSRGWGDLYRGTPLHFPMPCKEMEVLQILPCYTFGGVGGDAAAPGSNYAWPGE